MIDNSVDALDKVRGGAFRECGNPYRGHKEDRERGQFPAGSKGDDPHTVRRKRGKTMKVPTFENFRRKGERPKHVRKRSVKESYDMKEGSVKMRKVESERREC